MASVFFAELETPDGPVVIEGEGSTWIASSGTHERRGSLRSVLATVLGNSDPTFVTAVVAAVLSDTGSTGGRTGLTVRLAGPGEQRFHVSPAVNRLSIATHGLDWDRMKHPGIANSTTPECRGVYLCHQDAVGFFSRMSERPIDVWQVNVEGLWLHSDLSSSGGHDDDWAISAVTIVPDRLSLQKQANDP